MEFTPQIQTKEPLRNYLDSLKLLAKLSVDFAKSPSAQVEEVLNVAQIDCIEVKHAI
jgi:hypothetical protein